jgi:hypothetical protein
MWCSMTTAAAGAPRPMISFWISVVPPKIIVTSVAWPILA